VTLFVGKATYYWSPVSIFATLSQMSLHVDSSIVVVAMNALSFQLSWGCTLPQSSSSSSFISDSRSIEIRIKQHRGQTGNIQKYTQKNILNTKSERDQQDRDKNTEN